MKTVEHRVPNGDGWELSLFQSWDEERLAPGRNPVVIVPGYGMNSFIFSFHPRGPSLEGHLASAGFEVWRVDLRAQGGSTSTGGGDTFGLADLALTDLGAAIDTVLARTRTGAARVNVIGASLGGTIMLVHATCTPGHRIGAMVAIGTPVRWVKIHPLLRFAFRSPTLVGLLKVKNTRRLAAAALPHLAKRTPWVLSVYLNPSITDMSAAEEMIKTVEDPNRHINREIAHWIRGQDLIVRGINVSEALRGVTRPMLCVLARGDGIVPRETAEFVHRTVSSPVKAVLEVGDDTVTMAHADLFVSNEAHERVFRPVAAWLEEQHRSGAER